MKKNFFERGEKEKIYYTGLQYNKNKNTKYLIKEKKIKQKSKSKDK